MRKERKRRGKEEEERRYLYPSRGSTSVSESGASSDLESILLVMGADVILG
jgi:hypothetical protein